MADIPATAPAPAAEKFTDFKVVEVREDGTAAIDVGEGRLIVATVPDNLEVRKGSVVQVKGDKTDLHGLFTDAVVTKVIPK